MAAVIAVAGASGCTAPSDTSVSKAPHAFTSDLENTVILVIRRDSVDEDLVRQIGIVAQRHGLDDWRSVDESYVATGTGLRKAGVDRETARGVAELVSGGDAAARQLVMRAFDS